ncbi:MAG: hypothetical protein WA324_01240 [Bryobacteraceae bacterium]
MTTITDKPVDVSPPEVFARKFFPGRNVIGQHFQFEDAPPIDVQIIGSPKNTRYSSLKLEIPPLAFIAWSQRGAVIGVVQREVLALTSVGVALGLGMAWGMTRIVASFLFGIRPDDLVAFSFSAATLVLCALAAGYSPAWHASRIEPNASASK